MLAMPEIKCFCGRIINLAQGESQVEYFGDGFEGSDNYAVCKFCGRLFK